MTLCLLTLQDRNTRNPTAPATLAPGRSNIFLVSPGADFNGLRIGRHRPLNLLRPLSLRENSCVAQLVRSIRSFSSSDGCTAKPRRVALSGDHLPVFVIVRIVPGLQRGPAIVRLGSTD
ncbi:hypothetical protein VTJ04DRAFT_6736 [Mycothermus thermophilus]|uniref:uncharacterized protein n=1 Tax=Humicola insolens TaxID=85995 RepID=UPI00374401AE